jgi:hypothetical protein
MLLSRYQMRMKILILESVSPSLEKKGGGFEFFTAPSPLIQLFSKNILYILVDLILQPIQWNTQPFR